MFYRRGRTALDRSTNMDSTLGVGNTPVKKPSDEEITVDACANKCIDQKYFASNNKTCTCLKSNESLIETTFIRAEGCSEHNVLCHAFQSVLYETGLKMANKNISWYEAYQRCKEKDNNGSELGYPNNEMLLEEKLGSWFWVSLLRRPQLIWGKGKQYYWPKLIEHIQFQKRIQISYN
ncbi:unnamed protein product [Mytilus coruscus]|uniref:C-type lectin domain-containing protein n=1 Tax=Mytilus coruscus TaxID=42192 RepID=A0A6J8DC04_MYTCO|nr:unnamed protein product [Mytilus coruscus]